MITARDILAITYTNAAPQGDTFEEAMDYICARSSKQPWRAAYEPP